MQLINEVSLWAANPYILFTLFFVFSFLNVFFPPVPLESAVLFGGYLAGAGEISLGIVVGASVLGMSGGSVLLYFLIRRLGVAFIRRLPLAKSISLDSFHRATEWFRRYGIWAALIGKFIPGMSLCMVIGLGALHVEARKSVPILFFSNLIFFTLLGVLGNTLGSHWSSGLIWIKRISYLWIGVFLLLAIVTIVRWAILNFRPRRVKE
ncbi:MAG TPA: DedA family protein [Bacillota bacterium]|nr:DedA family protein [Bacillota bacterium]